MSHSPYFKRIATVSAAVMLFLVFIFAISFLTEATASAQVTQGEINRLRAEKLEYERQKEEVQLKIDAIEFEHMTEVVKKEVLDQRIMLTDLEIKNINNTIEQLYSLIREKEYEIFLAQNREGEQLQKYRNRVRDMEENGMVSYLEIVFNSKSFADLLARLDFINAIMRADKVLFDELQATRRESEEMKAKLDETKAELEGEKEQLEIKEAELQKQLEEAHELIRKLESDITAENQFHEHIIAEEARIQRELTAMVERLIRHEEAERQRRIEEGCTEAIHEVSITGLFVWPVPGGSVIGRFGDQRGELVHTGLDIAAAHGADIVAAESGTVVASRYGANIGFYVIIAHGSGIHTLYGHNSSNAVSVGDTVTRGQVIAYIGSSGNAYSPHIHFEVIVNGIRVNPERWL